MNYLNILMERFNFTRRPMLIDTDHSAFVDFLHNAATRSVYSDSLHQKFQYQRITPHTEKPEQYAGVFIDWLIIDVWGEAK